MNSNFWPINTPKRYNMKFSEYITESDSGTVKYAYNELCNSDIVAKIRSSYPNQPQVDMTNEGNHVLISVYAKNGAAMGLSKIKSKVKSLVDQILKPENLHPRIEFGGGDIRIFV